jgi:hypothetical protein
MRDEVSVKRTRGTPKGVEKGNVRATGSEKPTRQGGLRGCLMLYLGSPRPNRLGQRLHSRDHTDTVAIAVATQRTTTTTDDLGDLLHIDYDVSRIVPSRQERGRGL